MIAATWRPGRCVLHRLQQPVADHSLGLRAEDVERVRRGQVRVGGALQGQHPHLGAVAVGDDQLVLRGQRGQRLDRAATLASCTSASGFWPRSSRALPPSATTMRTSAAQRGDQHGLDRVHPVLGLVEDDRVPRLEDLVGDLEGVHAGLLEELLADLGVAVVEARAGSA